MRALESYVEGAWHRAPDTGTVVASAVTGEPIAQISSEGIDFGGVLAHARTVGGPALRRLTFHQRAGMLKALGQYLLEQKDELYALSTSTGATRADSWIDIEGGVGVLLSYASQGRRDLPNATLVVDGDADVLAKDGSFLGLHLLVPLEGAAVHINAFNFPCWGMLEKLGPALLAGVPAIVKPASQTAYLTEAMFRHIVGSGILPEGAVQLICGNTGDLFDHLTGQDFVGFTGSAATAQRLRGHPVVLANAVRFNAEADSLNCSVLGPTSGPGTPEFELYLDEVVKEMTSKAGQKCTAIRRALVPEGLIDPAVDGLRTRLAGVTVGNPADERVRMGALASLGQRDEVRRAINALSGGAQVLTGDELNLIDADPDKGAFIAPTLLLAKDARHEALHDVEAFGPVSTLIPYSSVDDAIELAPLGRGSLVASVFTGDASIARQLVLGMAAHHGRVLVVDERCGRTQTGHGSALPRLVHGGPGRAGGGEELGGIRGVQHYLQRTAVQGSPDTLTALTGTFQPGATRIEGEHPFRKHFDDLRVGDSLITERRTITIDDIERFADLTGDRFYAHMDEEAAKASPIFKGRVAHGYFVIAAAAGLFVWPEPGPVLANYGLDRLRFTTPVYPGDELHVVFTCKEMSPRDGAPYGEVRWDTQVINQNDEVVAAYDVLTMVACRPAGEERS
jgi:oxepin-CoA hydrolase / 3-oxo-5,6-dehydrosuberyl-CoA semialdehyde dehydrogenase